MSTEEERRRRRKREEEIRWQRVLAYYMMETYVKKKQAEAEAQMLSSYQMTARFIRQYGLVNRLFEKKGNEPSLAELLLDIGKDEPQDSAFAELCREIRSVPPSEERLSNAMTRVMQEEPPRLLDDDRKERERRTVWRNAHAQEIKAAGDFELVDEEQVRYEQRLEKKLRFFRAVMPPALYRELEQKLTTGEFRIDEAKLAEQEKQPERKHDLQSYMQEKRVEPKEKAGKLANAGDVYGAAAYMLAAWEQKDAPEFDEAKADARAMELSGSRAFKSYMKGHPGNLLAAARGTAIEETHTGVTALDADLKRRDAILTDARDNLKRMATGKTRVFHQMLNSLDRFVNADTEPTQKEKSGLMKNLAEYISTDCAPNSREYSKDCFTQAMRSVKALLPEDEFKKVVDQVNVGRKLKVRAEDFEIEPADREIQQEELARELQQGVAMLRADG